jgi:hypothetical protein
MARIIHEVAKTGMGFQPAAARQINGVRGDVVNRGPAVIDRRSHILAALVGMNVRCGNDECRRRIGSLFLDLLTRRQSQASRTDPHDRPEPFIGRDGIGRGETFVERRRTIMQSGETLG